MRKFTGTMTSVLNYIDGRQVEHPNLGFQLEPSTNTLLVIDNKTGVPADEALLTDLASVEIKFTQGPEAHE